MKNEFIFTYLGLLFLTATTAFIATSKEVSLLFVYLILGIATIKFLLVAFQFMELKKAHTFWKAILVFVLLFIILTITLSIMTY